MTDVASLAFTVDSSQALQGSQNLDRLRGSSDAAVQSHRDLTKAALDTQHGLGGLSDQARLLTQQVVVVNQSFDQLISKVQETRRAFDGSVQSFQAWDQLAQQANALGRAFGTTAAGLANYNQVASQAGFTSQQTASSLERLTLALDNQTAVGAQLRRTMAEYGVSLADLKLDQTDALFRRLTDSMSKAADTAKRTRDIQAVFGTLDPDSLGKVVNPSYVPIQDRRDQEISRTNNLDLERRSEALRQQVAVRQKDDARYSDLLDNTPGLRPDTIQLKNLIPVLEDPSQTRLTDSQLRALRAVAPEGSAFLREGTNTRAGRVALGEQIQGTDISVLNNRSGLTPTYDAAGNVVSGADIGATLNENDPKIAAALAAASARGNVGSATGLDRYGIVGSFLNRFQNGQNQQAFSELREQYTAAQDNANGIGDRLGNVYQYLIKERIKQELGLRSIPSAPAPTSSPINTEFGLGDELAGYGNNDVLNYQQATRALQLFGDQGSPGGVSGSGDVVGARSADAVGKIALENFTKAYGPQDAPGALGQARQALIARQRNALRPGGAAVDQANSASFVQSVGAQDRGKLQAFLAFAAGKGVDTSVFNGQSINDIFDPTKSGNGAVNPQLVRDFNQSYDTNSQTSHDQFVEQSNQRIDNIAAQGNVAGSGATNTQDLATFQNAYNEALKTTSDRTEAQTRANKALQEVDAQRLSQGKELIADLERTNDIETKRLQDTSSGGSALSRGIAGINAQIQADTTAESQRLNGQLDQTAYAKTKAGAQGNQAAATSQQIVGTSQDDLNRAQQILSVSDQRESVQRKMNSDLEIERSFTTALSQAYADDAKNGGNRVAQIEQAIQRTKDLKDATYELNQMAALYKLGRDSEQSAQDERQIALLPRDQQARARAQLQVQRLGRTITGNGEIGPEVQGGFAPQYAPPSQSGGTSFNNNNPTNLNYVRGQPGVVGQAGDFGVYSSPEEGIAAGMRQFLMDQDRGFNTLTAEINKRTPASIPGNHPDTIIAAMSAATGLDPNEQYDLRNPDVARKFLASNIIQETGRKATVDQINGGLNLAYNDPRYAVGGSSVRPTADQRNNAIGAAALGVDRGYNLGVGTEDLNLRGAAAVRAGNENRLMPLYATGQTGEIAYQRAGQYDPVDPNGATKAAIAQQEVLRSFTQQQQQALAQTNLSADSQARLATAYKQGAAAVTDLNLQLKVEDQARATRMTAAQADLLLQKSRVEETNKESAAIQQLVSSQKNSNGVQQAVNDLGPFASDLQVQRAQAQAQTDLALRTTYANATPEAKADFQNSADQTQAMKEQTDQVNQYRDAWKSAESATMSALNGLIVNGGSAKQVVGELAKSLAGVLLQLAEKPLMNALGNGVSRLFGFGDGGANYGVTGFTSESGTGGLYAAGGAFSGGVRMFAGGGILDRPTKFYASGGQPGVAGEVGDEAIVPLKRMANGNLGVDTGGSSKGGITLNANMTINNPTTDSGGKLNPQQARAMQDQMNEMARVAMVKTITDEKRPGGSLY